MIVMIFQQPAGGVFRVLRGLHRFETSMFNTVVTVD